ncbi:hypothetical protein LWM68_29565 [Niabella sp. W65]|nr:hypothetical protein [Niabella sp. W65]MCH7366551.1 hypothetical protein [Niabella sp. W65]ULT42257.1 hypothetical protein KRR40_01005 [Niabella sp. I65]
MIQLEDIHIRRNLIPGDPGFIAYMHGDLYAMECGYGLRFEAYVLEGLKDFIMDYDATRDAIWICEHNNRIIGSWLPNTGNRNYSYGILFSSPPTGVSAWENC